MFAEILAKIRKKVRRIFAKILSLERCEGVQILLISKKYLMLKNECLVAKIGFDTEENEPSKV